MDAQKFVFTVESETASAGAVALADALAGAEGVREAQLTKIDGDSMDIGNVVTVLAHAGALSALAQVLVVWLRTRRGASIRWETTGPSGTLKALITGIDPEAAARFLETLPKS